MHGPFQTCFLWSNCRYNKRQMSRIYPKGTRMDSSNYMPQMFWNVGCQMVALNFQTMDVPMQQNMALFEFNGQSGYLLKHEFMRRPDKQFDPFSVDRIDVVVASTLSITILSGQFLSERSVKTYAEVELFGLPGDPKRKYRTKLTSSANSINPVWKEEAFVFEKIMMPELASLRIVALEEGGKFIGHRIIPIIAVHSGYHHVCLRSESNMPLTMPSLFVYLEMKDYVPDTWADLTAALSNPIKFFNIQEKRSVKLKENSAERPDMQKNLTEAQTNGIPHSTRSFSLPLPNGPEGAMGLGKEETIKEIAKEIAELETASLEELQKMKLFLKLLKKQEKELKELERKGSKRREELLQRYSELVTQGGRKKILCPGKTQKKKRSLTSEEISAAWSPAEMAAEYAESQVLELKEKLEMELMQLWEEQYDGMRKKKEQHATEQIARLMEIAREKQAAEMKALKESSESDTKELKKKLEAKRLDRIQAMIKSTSDKTAQERLKREINNSHIQEAVPKIKQMTEKMEKYQQILEKKQSDCLEKIKEKESQLHKEALAEYEDKVKTLHLEVQDLAKNCMKVCFPLEANIKKEEALNTSNEGELGYKDQPEEKTPETEASGLETSMAETSMAQIQKIEISDQSMESIF